MSYAINKQGFWRLHLCRHTFPSLWGTCLLFACLWGANSRGDSCVLLIPLSNVCWGLLILSSDLKAFIFSKFAKVCYFVFVKHSSFKCLLNLRKVYIFHEFAEGLLSICVCWIIKILLSTKPSYFSAFLWKICPTPGACIKPGWLPQRPLYHKVNLLGYVAQRPLCHEVNLPRCSKSSGMWRLAALFHHDLWYFQHQTNEHFSSVYVINWAKLINQPTEVPLKSLQSTHSTKLLHGKVIEVSHTHILRKALMIPSKRVKLRGAV